MAATLNRDAIVAYLSGEKVNDIHSRLNIPLSSLYRLLDRKDVPRQRYGKWSCLWCEMKTKTGRHFCDKSCRRLYAASQRDEAIVLCEQCTTPLPAQRRRFCNKECQSIFYETRNKIAHPKRSMCAGNSDLGEGVPNSHCREAGNASTNGHTS
jgi:hypothetical protein